MPTGILIDVTAVILGGIIGKLASSRISEDLKETMTDVLGLCDICMGVSSVALMKNLPAVVLSVILGTLLGLMLHFGAGIRKGSSLVLNKFMKNASPEVSSLMVTTIVLFCAGSTGVYGSLNAGMTGSHSILVTKAILDFPTAVIFGCTLGTSVSLVAIPQFIVLFGLFSLAKTIVPLTTDVMIADFKACGGFVLVATGLRLLKVKDFPVADMTLSMLLVMPISHIWTTWLLPLIG